MNVKLRKCYVCRQSLPTKAFKKLKYHRFEVQNYSRTCKECEALRSAKKQGKFKARPDFEIMGQVCQYYVNGVSELTISKLLKLHIATVREYITFYYGDGKPVRLKINLE